MLRLLGRRVPTLLLPKAASARAVLLGTLQPQQLSVVAGCRYASSHKAPRFMAPELSRCSGCGSTLQSHDERTAGYVPENKRLQHVHAVAQHKSESKAAAAASAAAAVAAQQSSQLTRNADGEFSLAANTITMKEAMSINRRKNGAADKASLLVCQRCYRIEHYGEVVSVGVSHETYVKLLAKHLKDKPSSLVVLVADLLDFPGSILTDVAQLIGTHHSVLLVGNKVDMLPKDASRLRMQAWLKRQIVQLLPGFQGRVHLCSARTGEGVEELIRRIETWRNERDVFVIGCTNVGKSQLVNALTHQMKLRAKNDVTTSPLPGTTINVVRFPLGKDAFLFDTPGILYPHHLAPQLTPQELKMVVPHRELKPVTYTLTEGRSLLLGGLGRLDVITSEGTQVLATLFVSPLIPIHVTKTHKVPDLFAKHLGTKLLEPPCELYEGEEDEEKEDEDVVGAPDAEPPKPRKRRLVMSSVPTKLSVSGKKVPEQLGIHATPDRETNSMVDVIFPGLGWASITVSNNVSATLEAFTVKGLRVTEREPLLPYEVQKRLVRERGGLKSQYFNKVVRGPRPPRQSPYSTSPKASQDRKPKDVV